MARSFIKMQSWANKCRQLRGLLTDDITLHENRAHERRADGANSKAGYPRPKATQSVRPGGCPLSSTV